MAAGSGAVAPEPHPDRSGFRNGPSGVKSPE